MKQITPITKFIDNSSHSTICVIRGKQGEKW